VWKGVGQSRRESGSRSAEEDVVVRQPCGEIRRRQIASRRVDAARNGVEAVDTAVLRPVGIADEARFPDRSVPVDEGRNGLTLPGLAVEARHVALGIPAADLTERGMGAGSDYVG